MAYHDILRTVYLTGIITTIPFSWFSLCTMETLEVVREVVFQVINALRIHIFPCLQIDTFKRFYDKNLQDFGVHLFL